MISSTNRETNHGAGLACMLLVALVFGGCTSIKSTAKDFARKMAPTPHIPTPAEAVPIQPGVRRILEGVQGKIRFPHGIVSVHHVGGRERSQMQSRLRETHFAVERALLLMPENNQLVIIGHSDPIGGPGQSVYYGAARARSVRNYLVSKGIDAKRLVAVSAGASELLNHDQIRAPENHRVTFTVKSGPELPKPKPAIVEKPVEKTTEDAAKEPADADDKKKSPEADAAGSAKTAAATPNP